MILLSFLCGQSLSDLQAIGGRKLIKNCILITALVLAFLSINFMRLTLIALFFMYVFEGLINQQGPVSDGWAMLYFRHIDLAFSPVRAIIRIHDLSNQRAWGLDNVFFDFRIAIDPETPKCRKKNYGEIVCARI